MRAVDELPPVSTIKDLARFLRLHEHTVRADLSRRPDSLPPRMHLPGRRSVRFLREDVIAWLHAVEPNPPKGQAQAGDCIDKADAACAK